LEKSPNDRYQSANELMGVLRSAIEEKQPPISTSTSLPPIPVNAPTIRRSEEPLQSFTRRRDVITELEKRTTNNQPYERENTASSVKNKWLVPAIILLLLLLGGGYVFRSGVFSFLTQMPTKTLAVVETVALEDTLTPTKVNTVTATDQTPTMVTLNTITPANTATLTLPATDTLVAPSETSTPVTMTGMPAIVTATSTPVSTGHLMTAFYNESSFYILDRAKASRSLSGFAFERYDKDNVVNARFEGWEWEKFFSTIQPNRCVNILVNKPPTPYLSPIECENRLLSTLAFEKDSENLFWLANEESSEFRILWLEQEIARCNIEAGTCDFHVP